ncbi:hypothetical protein C0039_15190 [Pseudohalioglobus lutimaris]|uniref:Uncharacterized protein n=2 Tax=Pseudohalioglobus lutimaris TaxID=1737061 RepID=A0A2N5WZU2_9GAMM|nr:hypothetical protein C0039_15190 [Pseudohalioglobus lutimaris]
MIDLKDNEIRGLVALCSQEKRAQLASLCESPEQARGLISALDEINWQLASSGHEDAIEALASLVV